MSRDDELAELHEAQRRHREDVAAADEELRRAVAIAAQAVTMSGEDKPETARRTRTARRV